MPLPRQRTELGLLACSLTHPQTCPIHCEEKSALTTQVYPAVLFCPPLLPTPRCSSSHLTAASGATTIPAAPLPDPFSFYGLSTPLVSSKTATAKLCFKGGRIVFSENGSGMIREQHAKDEFAFLPHSVHEDLNVRGKTIKLIIG